MIVTGTRYDLQSLLQCGLKLKVRKFVGLITTFVKVTIKKLVGGLF